MKKIHYLLGIALLFVGMPVLAQVSNDNEDEVYKVARPQAKDFVPGQVIVKFKDGSGIQVQQNAQGKFRAASINAVNRVLRDFNVDEMNRLFPAQVAKPQSKLRRAIAPNGQIVQEKNLDKIFMITLQATPNDATLQLVKQLEELPDVEYAEPNYYAYITADMPAPNLNGDKPATPQARKTPASVETTASVICPTPGNNPLYSNQYGITQQNIHQLWNKPIINKKRPVIAILDTGVDINHPDLKDNIWTNPKEGDGEPAYDDDDNGLVDDVHGWDFIENYYETPDRNGHGTHCAGIAAAADNTLGVVGANPLALIMPIKVMNDRGVGDEATIARGIIYAAENGADILSMSFGSHFLSKTIKDVLDVAYQSAILVAAAGNEGNSIYTITGKCFPGAYHLVLGVEAIDQNGYRASFTNYDPDGPIYSEEGAEGVNYEIQVPGVGIYSTYPNGNYKSLNGTSMSTPLFAGAVSALMMVKDYPSKDVLYGDLIHLKADFAKIYSDDTPRKPVIDIVAMNVDDNVEGNSNIDGQVDVGETVKFSPVIRNTWADATDIRLKLSVDNLYKDFVNIANPEVSFGHSLSAYGRATAETPIQVKFKDNIGDNTRIKFTLEASCHENTESFTQTIYVTVNNMVKLGGLITENRTLTADHAYHVTENIGIPEGVTLTIEPGTRLEFDEGMGLSSDGKLVADGTPEKPIVFAGYNGKRWSGVWGNKAVDNSDGYWKNVPKDTISYCRIENCEILDRTEEVNPYMKDCIYTDAHCENISSLFQNLNGLRIMITDCYVDNYSWYDLNYDFKRYKHSNIVNNIFGTYVYANENIVKYSMLENSNYFNNYFYNTYATGKYAGKRYLLGFHSSTPAINSSDTPSYLGTGREDVVRPLIYEIGNSSETFGYVDLSNMPKRPYAEAHGIVWKVLVDGKDAQDEFESLTPLGVGKHNFEVYFNRPMNKAVAPIVSFGVREPYNQHEIAEEGKWNAEGTIYTVSVTITGKTMSDGKNRIYVRGAEDNEFFPCPEEKTRFNFLIGAAGSLATGFAAEAGMGRVNLTWNNDENDFDDAMGFNIYRYHEYEKLMPVYDEWGNAVWETDEEGNEKRDEYGSPIQKMEPRTVADTLRLNTNIVDIETTEYTDYDVTPGTTYHYYYKVLSTDLQEYDVSNVVAATPLTATLGDANGSGVVDVADVITTVNYAAGMEPKPFIFEAADMNADMCIDILDVIGIIQKILNPSAPAMASVEATAVYTIENGVLYVESPVALAGVQAQLNVSEELRIKNEAFATAADLDGFEHTSAWLSENDMLFLAYNLNGKTLAPGKHALLKIGDADVTQIRLSDTQGRNVEVVAGEGTTAIDAMGSKVMLQGGIFNLKGQKVAGKASDLQKLPKGVYIVNGEKVVK